MLAFAANSLLCRAALGGGAMDPVSFTVVRMTCGAAALWLLVRVRGGQVVAEGNWISAGALLAYAAGFSFAYASLPAGMGALLLFGAVQVTMIARGLSLGERFGRAQVAGFACALAGILILCWPTSLQAPWAGLVLMLLAGVAWGVYSLRGRGVRDPLAATAGNFLRAAVLALALALVWQGSARWDGAALVCAATSGALASGVGYAIWYGALRELPATTAATVQLSVPVLAASGGILLLGEVLTWRLAVASVAVLGGIAWYLHARPATALR